MSHEGSCHCGRTGIVIADDPLEAVECNCSICRRTGALWTYGSPGRIVVAGEGVAYVQGDRMLKLFHCPICGITTHWAAVDPNYDRMGVNLRLFNPALWGLLPRRFVDGASW